MEFSINLNSWLASLECKVKVHTKHTESGRGPQYSEAAAGYQEGVLKAPQMVLEACGEVAEMSSKTSKCRLYICLDTCSFVSQGALGI